MGTLIYRLTKPNGSIEESYSELDILEQQRQFGGEVDTLELTFVIANDPEQRVYQTYDAATERMIQLTSQYSIEPVKSKAS